MYNIQDADEGAETLNIKSEIFDNNIENTILDTKNNIDDNIPTKTSLDTNDYFSYVKWKDNTTIFNSKQAALLYCNNIISTFNNENNDKFIDPDFGCNSIDPNGLNSLY